MRGQSGAGAAAAPISAAGSTPSPRRGGGRQGGGGEAAAAVLHFVAGAQHRRARRGRGEGGGRGAGSAGQSLRRQLALISEGAPRAAEGGREGRGFGPELGPVGGGRGGRRALSAPLQEGRLLTSSARPAPLSLLPPAAAPGRHGGGWLKDPAPPPGRGKGREGGRGGGTTRGRELPREGAGGTPRRNAPSAWGGEGAAGRQSCSMGRG